jgi:hypothetical protein
VDAVVRSDSYYYKYPGYPDLGAALRLAAYGAAARAELERFVRVGRPNEQANAAFALGIVRDPRSATCLLEAARSGNIHAVDALGRLGVARPDIIAGLAHLAAHPKPWLPPGESEYGESVTESGPPMMRRTPQARLAAQEALYRLCGRAYPNRAEYYPPEQQSNGGHSTRPRVERGAWAVSDDRVVGAADTEGGRLWIATDLPDEYRVTVHVTVLSGSAGLSFGSGRDFHPYVDILHGVYWCDLGLEVTRNTFRVYDAEVHPPRWCGRRSYFGPDMCSMLVRSRLDLPNRLALWVRGGSAEFTEIRLVAPRQGAPPTILFPAATAPARWDMGDERLPILP